MQISSPNQDSHKAGPYSSSKPASILRAQQTEEAYSGDNELRRVLEKAQKERFQAILEKELGTRDRDQATVYKDHATWDMDRSRDVEGRVEKDPEGLSEY